MPEEGSGRVAGWGGGSREAFLGGRGRRREEEAAGACANAGSRRGLGGRMASSGRVRVRQGSVRGVPSHEGRGQSLGGGGDVGSAEDSRQRPRRRGRRRSRAVLMARPSRYLSVNYRAINRLHRHLYTQRPYK